MLAGKRLTLAQDVIFHSVVYNPIAKTILIIGGQTPAKQNCLTICTFLQEKLLGTQDLPHARLDSASAIYANELFVFGGDMQQKQAVKHAFAAKCIALVSNSAVLQEFDFTYREGHTSVQCGYTPEIFGGKDEHGIFA